MFAEIGQSCTKRARKWLFQLLKFVHQIFDIICAKLDNQDSSLALFRWTRNQPLVLSKSVLGQAVNHSVQSRAITSEKYFHEFHVYFSVVLMLLIGSSNICNLSQPYLAIVGFLF